MGQYDRQDCSLLDQAIFHVGGSLNFCLDWICHLGFSNQPHATGKGSVYISTRCSAETRVSPSLDTSAPRSPRAMLGGQESTQWVFLALDSGLMIRWETESTTLHPGSTKSCGFAPRAPAATVLVQALWLLPSPLSGCVTLLMCPISSFWFALHAIAAWVFPKAALLSFFHDSRTFSSFLWPKAPTPRRGSEPSSPGPTLSSPPSLSSLPCTPCIQILFVLKTKRGVVPCSVTHHSYILFRYTLWVTCVPYERQCLSG